MILFFQAQSPRDCGAGGEKAQALCRRQKGRAEKFNIKTSHYDLS